MDFGKKAIQPSAMRLRDKVALDLDAVLQGDDAIAELSLLLPSWEAKALERVASSHGLTVGQALRSMVRDFLSGPSGIRGEFNPAQTCSR
jgi:hypothetical protein